MLAQSKHVYTDEPCEPGGAVEKQTCIAVLFSVSLRTQIRGALLTSVV
jgi:hypothetical protein